MGLFRYSLAAYCKSLDIYSDEMQSHFIAGSSSVDVIWSHSICKNDHSGCSLENKL